MIALLKDRHHDDASFEHNHRYELLFIEILTSNPPPATLGVFTRRCIAESMANVRDGGTAFRHALSGMRSKANAPGRRVSTHIA
jgi:hypothetical protein